MSNITIQLSLTQNTDISSALKTALDTPHDNGILTVNFPATGTYFINSIMNVFSDTVIDFKNCTIKRSISTTNPMFRIGYQHKGIFAGVWNLVTKGYGGGGKNVIFKNGKFVGRTSEGINYNTSISAHHVEGIQLVDCTYTDALNGSSALGLFGCRDVKVNGCTFTGFTPKESMAYIQCIRVDGSTKESLNDLVGAFDSTTCDGLATKNVVVERCNFLPTRDASQNVLKVAPNPIGSHRYVVGMNYSGIKFLNNVVEDCLAYGDISSTINNSGAWIRFYAVKADPSETNIEYQKVGAMIQGNTFTDTRTEDLTLVSGYAKKPINNSVIYFQTKHDAVALQHVTSETGSAQRWVPQASEDVEIVDNRFVGINSQLSDRPIVCIKGIAGDSYSQPVYGDTYAKNIEITGNHFKDCYNYAKRDANVTNGVVPAHAVSNDCVSLTYVKNAYVAGNDFNKCRRALYATLSSEIYLLSARCRDVEYLPVSINNIDNYEIRYVDVNSTCTGGFYTNACSNGKIEYNTISSVGIVSSSYMAFIAVKESSNININNNILTNSPTVSKQHTYGIRAYTNVLNVSQSSNTFSGFTTNVSIE